MEELFAQLKREKQYLNNLSRRTIKYLSWVFNRWQTLIGQMPDKTNIKDFVIKLVEFGVSPFTTNSYIRAMNTFFTWLYENEHTKEHLKIKLIKEGQRTLKIFSEKGLKHLLAFRPKIFPDHRFYMMMCLMIDTGIRINEALSLKRNGIDFENLLITVHGKGDKERIVPISREV